MIQFSTNSGGALGGNQIWNTLAGDGAWDLWVSRNQDGTNPQNGPSDAAAGVSIPLSNGTLTLYFFGSAGQAVAFNGMNLFFNNAVAPGISVFGPLNTTSFSADSSASTLTLNGTTTPGAGTLSFTSGLTTVTVTGYTWNDPTSTGLPVGDFVSSLSFAPDSLNDFRGSITLDVTTSNAPEPSTVIFAVTGFTLLAGIRLRRR